MIDWTTWTANPHLVANVAIAAAYATLPVTALWNLARFPRDVRLLVVMFILVFMACAVGHLFSGLGWSELAMRWHGVTAIVSWLGAIAFFVFVPKVLRYNAVLSMVVENIPIGLGLLQEISDETGMRRLRWKLASNRAIVDLGLDPQGRTLSETVLVDSTISLREFLAVLDTNVPILQREFQIHHPLSDRLETYLLSCVNLPNRYLWVIWQDITERQEAYASLQAAKEKLEWQATHDYLTQANNLVLFDRLQMREPERFSGVLSIDIDRFRNINETLGHDVGDLLLQEVVRRLRERLCDRDVLVRTGADGFLILIENGGPTDGCLPTLTQRLYKSLRQPFTHFDRELTIDACIGFVDRSAGNLTSMRIAADIAMYVAKSNPLGERTIAWTHDLMERVCARQAIALDLERALHCLDEEFELYYQPIVCFADPDRCHEVEALLRWESSRLGRISPGVFIPLAEETGTIAQLSDWVIEQSIAQVSRWQHNVRVALNVSPWDLERDGFVERILRLCEAYGVRPSRIGLEVTERATIDNVQRFTDALEQLSIAGIRLKIDDFGTGDSGLGRVLEGRWSEVKIDRSLLPERTSDLGRIAICRAIANLCRDLNIRSLAEGIETEEQLQLLSKLNIEDALGYLFAKPMPEAELLASGWVQPLET